MQNNEKEYYGKTSAKFFAYEMLLSHILHQTMNQVGESSTRNLREALFQELSSHTEDPALHTESKVEMRRVVSEIWMKVERME